MPRVRVHTSFNPVQARLIESRFQEAGLPVKMQLGGSGVGVIQPGGPFEFWAESEDAAKDPAIKEIIRSVTRSDGFTDEEADEIEHMELKDEATEVGYATYLLAFIVGIVAIYGFVMLLVWLVGVFRSA